MSDMELMSKDQERAVFDAVRAAIVDTNSGIDPSLAIAKQASERHLTPQIASRMVEAFNVSKTLKHLKTAKGEEKLASLELADPSKVLAAMYPDKQETPAEKAAAVAPPSQAWYTGTIKLAEVLSEKHATVRREERVSGDLHSILSRAHSVLRELRNNVKCAEQAEEFARREAVDAVMQIADYFQHDLQHIKFAEMEEVVWGHFGDDGRALMNVAHGITKAAGCKFIRAQKPDVCIAPREQPYDLVYTAMDKRAAYADAQLVASTAAAELATYEKRLRANEDAIVKLSEGGMGAQSIGLAAGGFALGSLQDTMKEEPTSKSDAVGKMLENVADPKFEGQRQALDATMLLHGMMTTDPIIRHHKPEQVMAAFNELAASYPNLVQQPVALRIYLSKMLEGRLDAFDATSATGIEKDMRLASNLLARQPNA